MVPTSPCQEYVVPLFSNTPGTKNPHHKNLVKPLSREFITLKISVGIKYYLTNVLEPQISNKKQFLLILQGTIFARGHPLGRDYLTCQ
jgi:hypothetical protein